MLVESKYQPHNRNSCEKILELIKKEFPNNAKEVTIDDIKNFYWLKQDWEQQSRRQEEGYGKLF